MTVTRPSQVPATARYYPSHGENYRWVIGAEDEEGRLHGAATIYADAGYVHAECTYVHGVQDGTFTAFHPDGTVASVGDWRNGTLFTSSFFRGPAGSPEPFPKDCGASVHKVSYVSHDGVANQQVLYFDQTGVEVCDTGDAMPAHPEGVDPDARFFPRQGKWLVGGIARTTNGRVGNHREWSTTGTLLRDERYAADGTAICKRRYFADGSLKSESEYVGKVEVRSVDYVNGKVTHLELRTEGDLPLRVARYRADGTLYEERRWLRDAQGLYEYQEIDKSGTVMSAFRNDVPAPNESSEALNSAALQVELHDAHGLRARGSWREERLVGTWEIFADDGAMRTRLPLEQAGNRIELRWSACMRALETAAFLQASATLAIPSAVAAVPWHTLSACYSKAKELPALFAVLLAPLDIEPLAYFHTTNRLAMQVVHQGTVYPATVAAIPFIYAALKARPALQPTLLRLLQAIADGASEFLGEAKEDVREKPERSSDSDGDWRYTIIDTMAEIAQGAPVLEALIAGGDADVQQRALSLLRHCNDEGVATPNARLIDCALRGATPVLRAIAVDAALVGQEAAPDALVACLHDADPLVQMSAAIAFACSYGPAAPHGTDRALADALAMYDALAPRYAALPFVEDAPLAYLAIALGSLRTPLCFEQAPAVIARLPTVSGVAATSVGRGLLALALGSVEPPFMPGFVEVFAGIAAADSFFAFNVNAAEVLRDFGLEAHAVNARAMLQDLVAELRAAPDPQALYLQRVAVAANARE